MAHSTVQMLYLRDMFLANHHVGESRVSNVDHLVLCQLLYRLRHVWTAAHLNTNCERIFDSGVCLIQSFIENCLIKNIDTKTQTADEILSLFKEFQIHQKQEFQHGIAQEFLHFIGFRLYLPIYQNIRYHANQSISPLNTKSRPLYLKSQSVPRCKHFML
jgi:hypothetical protein